MIGTNKYGALGDSFSASRTLVERNLEKLVVDVAVGPHYTCAICSGLNIIFFSLLSASRTVFQMVLFGVGEEQLEDSLVEVQIHKIHHDR